MTKNWLTQHNIPAVRMSGSGQTGITINKTIERKLDIAAPQLVLFCNEEGLKRFTYVFNNNTIPKMTFGILEITSNLLISETE